MAAPNKAAQEAESRQRADAGIHPGENTADALDVIDDGSGGDGAESRRTAARPAETDPNDRPLPTPKGPFDNRRADIVARFRTDRGQTAEDKDDDISDFTRSGLPPEFAAPGPGGEPAADAEAAAAADGAEADASADADAEAQAQAEATAAPKTVRVKVRGQEQDLPLEDVIRHAQISLAADNYLDEAKGKLKEVDTLLRDTRDKSPRAGQDGVHPAAPQRAQTEPGPATADDPQHPGEIDQLIETIQFGDPAEARDKLEKVITAKATTAANTAVAQGLQVQRLQDEGARTQKVLQDFTAKHADLANDPLANAAIERRVFDLQVEDLRAIGIDPPQLAGPNGVVTPAHIAEAHRHYRANGFQVRTPQALLEKAMADFLDWKGVKPTQPTADPAQRGQPRIDVSVDRTARRQAVPQQPSRTVAPRPAAPREAPQPRDRSEIVRSMKVKRDAPRMRVLDN